MCAYVVLFLTELLCYVLRRFKKPVRKRSFDIRSSNFLLLLGFYLSTFTASLTAMTVDQSKHLSEGITAITVSFVDVDGSFLDTQGSFVDIQSSFADAQFQNEGAIASTVSLSLMQEGQSRTVLWQRFRER